MNLPHWPDTKNGIKIDLGLDRVLALLQRLGNPHKKLPPTIHIAGTNGKGSTLAYLDEMLKSAKYKVHKYTSPHLVKFNERIVLGGLPIDDVYLEAIIKECEEAANIKPKIDVTFFEGITVAAFLAFSRMKADVLLLETGMGGRLDATNVIEKPLLTIITSISKDHTDFLGDTLSQIAFEKAGIIKENSPVVVANQQDEILEVINRKADGFKNSPVINLGKHFDVKVYKDRIDFTIASKLLRLPLPGLVGHHQIENACLAIAALYVQGRIKININDIKNGLTRVRWRGRIEKIKKGSLRKLLPRNYDLYLDGSHNADASKALSSWISRDNMEVIKSGKQKPKTYLICSMLKDKDPQGFFKYLAGSVDFVVGVPIESESKAQKASTIAKHASNSGIKASYSDDFNQAFKYVSAIHGQGRETNLIKRILPSKRKADNPARVIVCGSLHLVGEFLQENG
jgi:dihydrofolate synthase/folylpolyglutamate synthase